MTHKKTKLRIFFHLTLGVFNQIYRMKNYNFDSQIFLDGNKMVSSSYFTGGIIMR